MASSFPKIALIGNPNSGKTSLFNALTGLNQQIGNYPGVTVDKKTGSFKHSSVVVQLMDLPGTYSLNPKSEDEKIATLILGDKNNPDFPDLVVYVADASNLKRSLLLATQIMDKGIPVVIALNVLDLAKNNGQLIDDVLLSRELGLSVVPINARNSKGLDRLKVEMLKDIMPVYFLNSAETGYQPQILARFEKINRILERTTTKTEYRHIFSKKLDQVLLHPILGYVSFLTILFLIFQSIFAWAEYPMQWIESGFGLINNGLSAILPPGVLTNLLLDGVLAGLGGIVIFIPQIALLFFYISILEDSGYMTRVSFIMDKFFRKFGLNGKSVIPLISGVACAVPAIMSARTIANKKERLLTIMVTPLMTCAARIPVYILIISIIIPDTSVFGIFNYQGLALTALYFMGIISSFIAARVFNYFIKSEERSSFIMEMPVYRMPRWTNIFYSIFEKIKVFIFDAGKIIVAISIVLWALSSYGPSNKLNVVHSEYKNGELTTAEYHSKKLENSYAGIFGKAIEPVIEPLGFNWKMGIALITSFAAREVFVGTMATIYSIEDDQNISSIRTKMANEKNPVTGEPVYSFAVGMSLLVFYAFAMQCMSTLAVVYRETQNIKWPVIQLIYMSGMAYLLSFLAYSLLKP